MKRLFSIVLLVSIFTFSFIVYAAQNNSEGLISKDEVRDRIIIWTGNTFENQGIIKNDLYVAGSSIKNTGDVEGDIFGVARHIQIGGNVSGSVRTAAQKINITGNVNRNVVIFGDDISLDEDSEIKGSVSNFGRTILIKGKVAKDLNVYGKTVTIDGNILGDTYIESDVLEISPDTKIQGNLTYKAYSKVDIPSDVVKGKINKLEIIEEENLNIPKQVQQKSMLSLIFKKVMWIISSFLVSALFIKLFTKFFSKSLQGMHNSWAKFMGIGLIVFAAMPITFLMMLFTVVGIPLAMVSIILYSVLIYLAKIPVSLFIGDIIIKQQNIYLKLLLGLTILSLLYSIPFISLLIKLSVIVLGLGTYIYNLFFNKDKTLTVE